jgi:hypothetical protein
MCRRGHGCGDDREASPENVLIPSTLVGAVLALATHTECICRADADAFTT